MNNLNLNLKKRLRGSHLQHTKYVCAKLCSSPFYGLFSTRQRHTYAQILSCIISRDKWMTNNNLLSFFYICLCQVKFWSFMILLHKCLFPVECWIVITLRLLWIKSIKRFIYETWYLKKFRWVNNGFKNDWSKISAQHLPNIIASKDFNGAFFLTQAVYLYCKRRLI